MGAIINVEELYKRYMEETDYDDSIPLKKLPPYRLIPLFFLILGSIATAIGGIASIIKGPMSLAEAFYLKDWPTLLNFAGYVIVLLVALASRIIEKIPKINKELEEKHKNATKKIEDIKNKPKVFLEMYGISGDSEALLIVKDKFVTELDKELIKEKKKHDNLFKIAVSFIVIIISFLLRTYKVIRELITSFLPLLAFLVYEHFKRKKNSDVLSKHARLNRMIEEINKELGKTKLSTE